MDLETLKARRGDLRILIACTTAFDEQRKRHLERYRATENWTAEGYKEIARPYHEHTQLMVESFDFFFEYSPEQFDKCWDVRLAIETDLSAEKICEIANAALKQIDMVIRRMEREPPQEVWVTLKDFVFVLTGDDDNAALKRASKIRKGYKGRSRPGVSKGGRPPEEFPAEELVAFWVESSNLEPDAAEETIQQLKSLGNKSGISREKV